MRSPEPSCLLERLPSHLGSGVPCGSHYRPCSHPARPPHPPSAQRCFCTRHALPGTVGRVSETGSPSPSPGHGESTKIPFRPACRFSPPLRSGWRGGAVVVCLDRVYGNRDSHSSFTSSGSLVVKLGQVAGASGPQFPCLSEGRAVPLGPRGQSRARAPPMSTPRCSHMRAPRLRGQPPADAAFSHPDHHPGEDRGDGSASPHGRLRAGSGFLCGIPLGPAELSSRRPLCLGGSPSRRPLDLRADTSGAGGPGEAWEERRWAPDVPRPRQAPPALLVRTRAVQGAAGWGLG